MRILKEVVVRYQTEDERIVKAYDQEEIIRCKDCKWFGKSGCAILIVDESDKPKEDDFCSWAERREK